MQLSKSAIRHSRKAIKRSLPQPRAKVTLRWVLVIPFALQIGTAVGIVGFLAFRDGREAVNQVATQLRMEVTNSAQQEITTYLSTPTLINRLNAEAVLKQEIRLDNTLSEQHLWHQLGLFPDARWIYFGDQATGGHVVARRSLEGTLEVGGANPRNRNLPHFYQANAQGKRMDITEVNEKQYDARTRPWYKAAVKNRGAAWSPIYVGFSSRQLTLTASQAVYDSSDRLLGVLAVDLFLDDISQFLRQVQVGSGEIFIIESSGLMVASSSSERPFTVGRNNQLERISAAQSQDALIRSTAQYLNTNLPDLKAIRETQLFSFEKNGKRQFVQVSPIQQIKGTPALDWYIAVVIPEAEFLGAIETGTQKTAFLILLTTAMAVAVGAWTAHKLIQPIKELCQISTAIAQGDLEQRVSTSRIEEIDSLAQAFNGMTQQLQASVTNLERDNKILETRVNERTQELQQLNQQLEQRVIDRTSELSQSLRDLQAMQIQIIQRQKADALGQLVAGVAREINTPIHRIYGNLVPIHHGIQGVFELVSLYQEHYPEPITLIVQKGCAIDLDSLQAELPGLIDAIKTEANQIRTITTTLQRLTHDEHGEFKPTDLQQVINGVLMILKNQIKAQPHRPSIEVIKDYGNLPLAQCNATDMSHVLMNILTNAIDAIDERAKQQGYETYEAPTIQISTHRISPLDESISENDCIRIQISDNGIGMGHSLAQRVFEPFFTTKPFGKGTGLGLSMSYQIITEKHCGALTCQSQLGQGTEFTIEIPVKLRAPRKQV